MTKRKALGIGGSPAIKGNSNTLLGQALAGAEAAGMESELVYAHKLGIKGCYSCGGCETSAVCIVEDPMQPIYPKLFDASLIILASPLYFSGISAQLKAIIDRAQPLWLAHYVLNKPVSAPLPLRLGGFIGTRGQQGLAGFDCPERPPRAFLKTLKATYQGGLFFDNYDPSGIIHERSEDLEKGFFYGKGMAEKIIQADL